jgi:glycerol uptake facilitator protein
VSIFGAEVIGTGLLILLGNGVVAGVLLHSSKAENSGWIVITFGWGMAVTFGVFACGGTTVFSVGSLNPAVTLADAILGAAHGGIKWSQVPAYMGGEFVGAFIGATLVWLAYYAHWAPTEDAGAKLACFSTGPAIRNPVANFATEFIGTFVLIIGIFTLFHLRVIQPGLGAFLVGMLIFAIGLSLGGPTGYAINPARDLGPRIMHAILPIAGKGSSDWSYAWIPVVAPLCGAAAAAGFFVAVYPHQ